MTVQVELIDADSGVTFARTDSPAELLPDSFEADTTLHLAGQDWAVVSANPILKSDFVRAGRLVLRLRQIEVQSVDPQDVLFSLPTICDVLPGVAQGSSKLSRRVRELHEDDWRQVELISRAHENEIHREFAKIIRIHREQRTEAGAFRALHIRKAIPAPLANLGLSRASLERNFSPPPEAWLELAYLGGAGLIEGGFALALPGLELYGQQRAGVLCALGVSASSESKPQTVASLVRLMREYDLELVDWCRAILTPADEVAVAARLG